MKRLILSFVFIGVLLIDANAQEKSNIPHTVKMYKGGGAKRTEIILPQVKGFNCYKGDFHIHTHYSDGRITPAARVAEAWLDGLDIMAITDHYESRSGERNFFKVIAPYMDSNNTLEYQSASKANYVKADFNAIHQEAVAQLEKSGYPMLLIKGCEMARNAKTHGHFNCLFLNDNINDLYNKDLKIALRNAREQGAFITHNHPGWRRDTTDKTEFHEEIYKEGLIDGIEVVNGHNFYPPIVRRCIEEKLTMFANTDIHNFSTYNRLSSGIYRTMTFVFAKELTEKAVREALEKNRTLAYTAGHVIGEEEWLTEFANASIDCRIASESKDGESRTYRLTNFSSITYNLKRGKVKYRLEPFKTLLVTLKKDPKTGKLYTAKFTVENMWHIDNKNLVIDFKLDK